MTDESAWPVSKILVLGYTAAPMQDQSCAQCGGLQCDLLSDSGIELVNEELVHVMILMEGLIP